MASKIIPTLAGFPEKIGGEKTPNVILSENATLDSKKSDERCEGNEEDEVDDSDDDIQYLWKEVGSPFIGQLDSRIASRLENAPVIADFEEHQVHWQNFFSSLSEELQETNEASQQLTTPPLPELDIELLDIRDGKSCPCCLDGDRPSEGRIFTLQEESGITRSVFIKLLGDILYAEFDLQKYKPFRDIYEERLVIKGFNWMMGSYGEIWGETRTKFPRLYVYCTGKPVAAY
ncbi:hypothetical protein AOQ84DRAFT_156823 [Glonium stellatum]|uniref:Uncharacterized protein n=1 Tax=Glonium stellatum TaxID=574774 RepID=A0A8E2EQW4_9PEZI|nr:hypothetical protein AOQ84DRAFT_156823 [Glonium stellatum]